MSEQLWAEKKLRSGKKETLIDYQYAAIISGTTLLMGQWHVKHSEWLTWWKWIIAQVICVIHSNNSHTHVDILHGAPRLKRGYLLCCSSPQRHYTLFWFSSRYCCCVLHAKILINSSSTLPFPSNTCRCRNFTALPFDLFSHWLSIQNVPLALSFFLSLHFFWYTRKYGEIWIN